MPRRQYLLIALLVTGCARQSDEQPVAAETQLTLGRPAPANKGSGPSGAASPLPGGAPARPPAPPPQPSFTEQASDPDLPVVDTAELDVESPRAALLMPVVGAIRREPSGRGHPLCLASSDGVPASMLSHIGLRREGACGWSDGGVILRSSGEQAMFVHARLRCESQNRCAGEGGLQAGNMGLESNAYRLRRRGGAWVIERLGLQVVS